MPVHSHHLAKCILKATVTVQLSGSYGKECRAFLDVLRFHQLPLLLPGTTDNENKRKQKLRERKEPAKPAGQYIQQKRTLALMMREN